MSQIIYRLLQSTRKFDRMAPNESVQSQIRIRIQMSGKVQNYFIYLINMNRISHSV